MLRSADGAEKGDAASGRGWPLRVCARRFTSASVRTTSFLNCALQVHVQRDVRRLAVVSVGRRSVPPAERPSTGVGTEMGRERPRPRLAAAAPRPFSGVAHAPHVGVGDVLGRAPDGRRICALMTLQYPGKQCSNVS